MPHLIFKNEIDVGHILTVLALTAGFIWWIYTTQREWRKITLDDARSGALRLLLRILREPGDSITLTALREKFSSPAMKALRVAYCRRDFQFKNETEFEAAIYRLDEEGKIDFISPNEIAFRVDIRKSGGFIASKEDKEIILANMKSAIEDSKVEAWQLAQLAESSMRVAPNETSDLIRSSLKSTDESIRMRVNLIVGRIASPFT